MEFDANPVLLAKPTAVPACRIEMIAQLDVSESKAFGDPFSLFKPLRRDNQIDVTVDSTLALVVEPARDRRALQEDARDPGVVQTRDELGRRNVVPKSRILLEEAR